MPHFEGLRFAEEFAFVAVMKTKRTTVKDKKDRKKLKVLDKFLCGFKLW